MLGQGGFGITYLAYDLNLNGPVALKEYFPAEYARRRRDGAVLPNSRDSRNVFDWGLDRFLAEAQAIHQLRHPNVVRAHRYFRARGGGFIVMEYVEGDSLSGVLNNRGRLTFAEWRPLLEKLLDGLEHVHEHDYLHRDIKPANIVIRDVDGAPVIIDFGSARIATGERTHTQVFTPEYAPIEQHGKGQQRPPADLYALAAVSYRALLGELPPTAPDRVLEDSIKRLEQSVDGAERGWLAGLDRCLAVQPKDRPKSVAALREEFTKGRIAPDAEAVRNYRLRFEVPKSGRGKVLVKRLAPPLNYWKVRRWVGHRSSGVVNAAVFAPFHVSGADAGDASLFEKACDGLDEGYAWLLGLEQSGAIEEAARERIQGKRRQRTGSKRPPSASRPRPHDPPTGMPVDGESGRGDPRIELRTSEGSSVMPLSEWSRQLRQRRAKEAEERAQTAGKWVLGLWYGLPVTAAMCDGAGVDGLGVFAIGWLATAFVAGAFAFLVSKQNGVLMLTTLALLLGLGILAVQQRSAWWVMTVYFVGGAGVWWVGARLWRLRPSDESGSAA